jgi:peptidoglycan hydrolase CwlO-like protein
MNKKMTLISVVLGIIVSICTIGGSIYAVETHYAKKAEVQLLAERLDQKILQDRLYNIQERIWKLQDRYETIEKMPTSVKEEYRNLEMEKEQLTNILGKKG